MDVEMPNLVSFAIFDCIPPKEEGKDPTIFWYWPHSIDKDTQLNEIGLYMTFTGFCRDFRASQDCELIQTDKTLTVFVNMGSEINAAAQFSTDDPLYHRVCQQSIRTFMHVYKMFFHQPYRNPDDTIDVESQNIFDKYLDEMLGLFKRSPFMPRISPTLDLWNCCEEAISNTKSEIPYLRSAGFIYGNTIVHNTMTTDILINIYLSLRANMPTLFPNNTQSSAQSEFKWIMKDYNRELKLMKSTGYPTVVMYKKLFGVFLFSKFEDFSPMQKVLEELLPNIASVCDAAFETEQNSTPAAYRDTNNTILTRPIKKESVFGNQNKNELIVDFLGSNNNQFVRFCGKTETPKNWHFFEKNQKQITFLDGKGESIENAMVNFTEFLKAANFG